MLVCDDVLAPTATAEVGQEDYSVNDPASVKSSHSANSTKPVTSPTQANRQPTHGIGGTSAAPCCKYWLSVGCDFSKLF